MSSPSPPQAPDPAATAAAQTKSNKETAIAEFGLNAANQYNPQGSSTWQQIGSWPDGTPRYQQDIAYSPGEQQVYDTNLATRQNVGNIAVDQTGRIGALLGTPINLNNDAVESRLFDLGSRRLEPQFARDWDRTETTLQNRGALPGSEAYTREQDAFNRRMNDAYNQLALTGRQQSVQEIMSERNQPINEITALMSGSQVSQPQFQNRAATDVANTDVAGIYDRNYANQMSAYNAQNSSRNSMMGGLFGLGGSLLGGWGSGLFSDRRLKQDIRRVGATDGGLPIYTFRYIGEDVTRMGVMADEVEQVIPNAVTEIGGYKAVNYEALR